jgi:hypothetical protein
MDSDVDELLNGIEVTVVGEQLDLRIEVLHGRVHIVPVIETPCICWSF